MVLDDDPDFLALIEHLIGAEHCRQIIAAKQRNRTFERQKPVKRRTKARP
jgi:hypothetical protein